MTFSNSSFNPNPLANPFNTRLGPANYSLNPAGKSYMPNMFNSKSTLLPESRMLGEMPDEDIHTPDSSPPFRLHEIVAMMSNYGQTWDDRQIHSLNGASNQDKRSTEYWKYADLKSAEMLSSMSDLLKLMLADVEKMFPPSKLEDD